MKMKELFIVILASFLSSCASIDRPKNSDLAGQYYRVQEGDKLAAIAKKYRLNPEEIMEINGIDRAEGLKTGILLFLPDPDPIANKIKQYAKKLEPKKTQPTKTSTLHIFDFPVPGGIITRTFSQSKQKPYDGIGIKAKRGSPVLAALDGKVIFVGNDGTKFGLLAIIEHQEPYITVYTHLDSSKIKVGDQVKSRQVIGTVGLSGGLSSALLHFQIRVAHKPRDPAQYLKKG